MTPALRQRLFSRHFDAAMDDAATSATRLHMIAATLAPVWPRGAERLREIAAEHARMAEVLNQTFATAREERMAVGAGRG